MSGKDDATRALVAAVRRARPNLERLWEEASVRQSEAEADGERGLARIQRAEADRIGGILTALDALSRKPRSRP